MNRQKLQTYGMLALGSMLLIFYIATSYMKQELLCNILSTTIAAFATIALGYSHFKTSNKKSLSPLFFSLACFSWMVADGIWLLSYLQGNTPQNNFASTLAYGLTNVFLFLAVLFYVFYHFDKWKCIQLTLNILVVTLLSGLFAWTVFFQNGSAWNTLLWQEGIISAVSILLDFILLIGILITIYSIKDTPYPFSLLLFNCGIALYSLNDLYYYYIFDNKQYIPNTAIDTIYMLSLLILAFGGLLRSTAAHTYSPDLKNGLGRGSRWLLLFLFPFAMLFSSHTQWLHLIHSVAAIVMYKALSNQAQLATKQESLYRKELALNTTLEKRLQEQYGELVFFANHDSVTKLYNRHYFIKSLDHTIAGLQKSECLVVFMIDLDRFKTINDTLGHEIGDQVLIEISTRMRDTITGETVLARLGGDEFALYIKGLCTRDAIMQIAEDIIKTCSLPIQTEGNALHVTFSIGIAICPQHATTRIMLMRNADIAMYRAKAQGFNKYVFYDPGFVQTIQKKSEIELLLRKANIAQDFELYYQPQFDIATDKLIGAEALIRWKSTENSQIGPSEFIPIAEEIDYIFKIGKWVIQEAIEQIIQWNTAYATDLIMGINISPKQLKEDGFVSIIKKLICDQQAKSSWIDAEITEGILLEHDSKIASVFEIFKSSSISVSVDDFGEGYSSLGYLNKFAFNRIKIDQSLIAQLAEANTSSIQIVKAIITMAEALGITTIAEGVETEEQFTILKDLNCSQVQGYLLGRPVCAREFEEMFIKRHIAY